MKIQKIAILTIEDIISEYSLTLQNDIVTGSLENTLDSVLDWSLRIRSDEELVTHFIQDKLAENIVKKQKCSLIAVQLKDKLVIIYPADTVNEDEKE